MYFLYLLYIRRIGPVAGTGPRLPPATCCSVHGTGLGIYDVAMKLKAGSRFHPPACAKKNVTVGSGLTLVALQYSFKQ